MDVIVYHNPDCGTSRNTIGLMRNAGVEPHIIEYLKTTPTRLLLRQLIERMGVSVRDIIREKGTLYAELGLGDPTFSDDALLEAVVAHPILINRPIVVTPKGVRLCRPSELARSPATAIGRVRRGGWRARDRRTGTASRQRMTDTFSLSRRLAAEALGTGILVATVVGSGIMADKLAGGNTALALLGNTIPTGAILVVLILALGPISGAHFNPAVSLVMGITGALPWREVGSYAFAQIFGGCLGIFAAHGMFDLPLLQFGTTARTGPAQWFAEFVATFGLLVTILAVVRFRIEAIPYAVGTLHYGSLLVYRLDIFRQSGRDDSAGPDKHLRGNRACPCAAFPRRADGRRAHRYGPDAMAVAHPDRKSQLVTDLLNIDSSLLQLPDPNTLEARRSPHPPRILLLYGSLLQRSYRRFLTLERSGSSSTSVPKPASSIRMACRCRMPTSSDHPKVQESLVLDRASGWRDERAGTAV